MEEIPEMNICPKCRTVNRNEDGTCFQCGYEIESDQTYLYNLLKYAEKLRVENQELKSQSYHSYSNWNYND